MPGSDHVTIVEVGPRDGLQNEVQIVPTADKIRLVDLLSLSGLKRIEVTSFVSPKWVPQMADAADVLGGIYRALGVRYAALTPNLKGYAAAVAAGVDEVAVFASASETFSRKNINCSIAESLERFRPLMDAAAADRMPVRGYVSCVVACPYDGAVPPSAVAKVTQDLFALGCREVSLGDTIGAGTPESIAKMLDAVLDVAPVEMLASHFHDTGDRALENLNVSLEKGLRTIDSAVGGLGGCPYAPGAKGNVDTGRVVAMLATAGYVTGVNPSRLAEAEKFIESLKTHLG